jgi:hypothetical protein
MAANVRGRPEAAAASQQGKSQMLYEITTDDGMGTATYASRQRLGAADRVLYATIYRVAKSQALLDVECTRIALERLYEAIKFRAIGATRFYKLGHTTITISCSQLRKNA